jgi:acetolactate synthase-1/3 small subunit
VESRFTISLLTEREAGVLLRLVATLGRHRLRIESLATTALGASGLYRHTVSVEAAPDRVRRAMKQLDSSVGVLEARYDAKGRTIDRELGLYRLSIDLAAGGEALERLVRQTRARIVEAGPDYVVVEKTGDREELEELFGSLEPFGVMEFVRSGQATVSKPIAEGMVRHETNELEAPADGSVSA